MTARHISPAIGLAAVIGMASLGLCGPAQASPGYDFVCFGDQMTATIGFDLLWDTAFLTTPEGEVQLPASGPHDDVNSDQFAFSDGTWRFSGFAPEGRLWRGETVVGDCYQSKQSLKALALYDTDPYAWSAYNAAGLASGNVRARPTLQSQTVTSFDTQQAVTILENTDQFMDGFFWFRIGWDDGQTGYIWGALLCTDTSDRQLEVTLRTCS